MGSSEDIRADLDSVCNAQKSYVQTARLKGVSQAELWAERARKMREGLKTEAVKTAVEAYLSPNSQQAELFFALAKQAKLDAWSCQEFSQK
jgi:hypothetical protein